MREIAADQIKEIDEKLHNLIGEGNYGEEGHRFYVEFPVLEYPLPRELVDSWERPFIKLSPHARKSRTPAAHNYDKASLVVHRRGYTDRVMSRSVLAKIAELRLVPADPEQLHQIYSLITWRRKERERGINQTTVHAVTFHYKDFEDYNSPYFGTVHDDPPKRDQLEAFNRYLDYCQTVQPSSSIERHSLRP